MITEARCNVQSAPSRTKWLSDVSMITKKQPIMVEHRTVTAYPAVAARQMINVGADSMTTGERCDVQSATSRALWLRDVSMITGALISRYGPRSLSVHPLVTR